MYSALPLHNLAVEAGGVDYQGSLNGTNLPGDACLVVSADPKPSLRWTADLHERFVDAVTQLGGPDSSSTSAQDIIDGYQVTEALRMQMDVQRKFHEKLEVQRHLQIRLEAQRKYLQSILDKAYKSVDNQAVASSGLEAARKDLSELAIKVADDSNGMLSVPHNDSDTDKNSIPYLPARLGECSMDSGVMYDRSPISPSTLESQAAALKKRPRPLFSGGESPLDSSMKPVEWMMPNFG